MRIQSVFIWSILTLSMLHLKIKSTGYRLVSSSAIRSSISSESSSAPQTSQTQRRKRMAWPDTLYADLAAMNGAPGSVASSTSNDEIKCRFLGVGGSGFEMDGKNNQQCDVKQVFGTGNAKQRTSCIAIKAALDAKAANEAQQAAGQLAAQHIKQELAEKAFQSAKAAEAALMGKQLLLQQLEQETQEALAVVEEESNLLMMTESHMNAAIEAARVATVQFETLTELQKTAKGNLYNIQSVAGSSQQEMSAKVQLFEAAKIRLATLQNQLQAARDDYEKIKQAAYKAACAAVEANQKASSTNDARSRRRQRRLTTWLRSVAT